LEERRQILAKSHLGDDFFKSDLFVLIVFGVESVVEFTHFSPLASLEKGHALILNYQQYDDMRYDRWTSKG